SINSSSRYNLSISQRTLWPEQPVEPTTDLGSSRMALSCLRIPILALIVSLAITTTAALAQQNGQAGAQGQQQNGQAGAQGESQNGQAGEQGEHQNGQNGDQGVQPIAQGVGLRPFNNVNRIRPRQQPPRIFGRRFR